MANEIRETLQEQLTAAETKKTMLEVRLLEHPWRDYSKYIPLITSLVAVIGLVVSSYQTHQARSIEFEKMFTSERRAQAQHSETQIREGKSQLLDFISDNKVTTARVVFLLDDLHGLINQLPNRGSFPDGKSDRDLEEQKITELLQMIAWQLPFISERDIDFDVQSLQRWAPYRDFWVANAPSHHLLLSKKYDTAISNSYSQNKACVQALSYDARRGVFVSASADRSCEEGIFPVLLVGFKAHLDIMKAENKNDFVRDEIEEFGQLTEHAPIAATLARDYGISASLGVNR